MSDLNDSTGTIEDGRTLLSPSFLEFCDKVRNNDPSILPELGEPFNIRRMCEREGIELADALLENTNVTYLELHLDKNTKSSAEAMAKYVRTSKRLQRIRFQRGNASSLRYQKIYSVVFCLQFKKARRSRNYTLIFLSLVGRPTWRSKIC
jgi:hypothetical protein